MPRQYKQIHFVLWKSRRWQALSVLNYSAGKRDRGKKTPPGSRGAKPPDSIEQGAKPPVR